ncbi:hypothetical protein D9Q98_001824 [Chlorella vulgaris]|uniref:Apple domain-containing protein n=1 Tax=Chlorella vulgaris TaxID=3077 RepID=A0A9D4Z058_CHLVU|nr:hypothetical protein D9Q98_001824 [Chlorella vulgaris]
MLLACLSAVANADQVDWCYPRATGPEMPCPKAEQCCSIWGICGTGDHYCKKSHCARGACLDAPVAPESQEQPSTSPPVDGGTVCGTALDGVDLWGADVKSDIPGESLEDCCAACTALPTCGAFTFARQQRTCYLKTSSGWDRRAGEGMTSVVLEVPSIPQTPPTAPEPTLTPSPEQGTCGAALPDVDLFGGDIAAGVKTASNLEACCAACKAVGACGAFTFLPDSGNCYLKASTGWTRQNKPGSGMQSGILSDRATVAPTPSPKAPTPSPKAPTPSPKAPVPSPKPQSTGYKYVPMTEDQMRRMYQLTSVFENADINLQYGYAGRLKDGRGVTYGFCGFTTGTGDGLMTVQEYTRLKPNNPLARFLPALRSVAGKGDKFTGLDGFDQEVRKLAKDTDFIKAQWTICDKEYHEPAMQICRDIKCNHALTKAQLHDALVNHGQGLGDKFSVDYILAAAKKAVGGTPATGVNEVTWLKAFLQARYNLLYNWDRVARVSVKRITMYQKLVDAGNLNLDGPIYIDLQKRTQNGAPVWQIKDVYYGTFLIYENPSDDRRLALIV